MITQGFLKLGTASSRQLCAQLTQSFSASISKQNTRSGVQAVFRPCGKPYSVVACMVGVRFRTQFAVFSAVNLRFEDFVLWLGWTHKMVQSLATTRIQNYDNIIILLCLCRSRWFYLQTTCICHTVALCIANNVLPVTEMLPTEKTNTSNNPHHVIEDDWLSEFAWHFSNIVIDGNALTWRLPRLGSAERDQP